MGHYLSNVRDIEFTLFEVLKIQGRIRSDHVTEATVRELLGELNKLATGPLAMSFTELDRDPPAFDPATGTATVPAALKAAYRRLWADEWYRLFLPAALGGAGLPPTVQWAAAELLLGANAPLYLYFSAPPNCAAMLHRFGTAEQRHLAELMVERGWGATMAITEPDAGSDVGAARTTAVPQADGSWHVEGVKRFITSGDQDLTENIVHVVLARPAGARHAPGAKGLSVFLVPKYLFDPATGALGQRNGVYATNLERKMGLRGSTTCELTFGGGHGPAKGWLLGETHNGIAQMFHAIEWARMTVGTKAIATLSSGYLNALAYAKDRVQGPDLRQLLDKAAPRVPIIAHPDVRRMLMLQKAYAEGLRAVCLWAAGFLDQVESGDGDADLARRTQDLLLPIVKGVGSERAYEQLAQSLQVLGGSGFTQDYPIEQYLRDSKIDSLYEGTTAIQSLDFFFRKIVRDGGGAWAAVLDEVGLLLAREDARLKEERGLLADALDDVRGMVAAMTGFLAATGEDDRNVYKVGQNSVRLLMSVGDLLVGAMLIRQAGVALDALDAAPAPRDKEFYEGKVAVAAFFARTVLPTLTAARRIVESTDNALMEVAPGAF